MMTVVDQHRPWLTPSSMLAATTQPQNGATMSNTGTGSPTSHPATSTPLRPVRSERCPALRLASALTTPKLTMKESPAVAEARPNWRAPRSGTTSRSSPTMAPTNALMSTSRRNWPRLARSPSVGAASRVRSRPDGARAPAGAWRGVGGRGGLIAPSLFRSLSPFLFLALRCHRGAQHSPPVRLSNRVVSGRWGGQVGQHEGDEFVGTPLPQRRVEAALEAQCRARLAAHGASAGGAREVRGTDLQVVGPLEPPLQAVVQRVRR